MCRKAETYLAFLTSDPGGSFIAKLHTFWRVNQKRFSLHFYPHGERKLVLFAHQARLRFGYFGWQWLHFRHRSRLNSGMIWVFEARAKELPVRLGEVQLLRKFSQRQRSVRTRVQNDLKAGWPASRFTKFASFCNRAGQRVRREIGSHVFTLGNCT